VNSLHVLPLRGCAPTPLAHYLKALGVLRLVSEQVDSGARGAWVDGVFHLVSKLTRSDLETFFLRAYQPTPLLSPWNGGSGFYPSDNQDGFGPIRQSEAPRYSRFRAAMKQAETSVGERKERPAGDEKAELLRECLATWDENAYGWLRSAYTIGADSSPSFPALLGTGGNDGRLDFTNNYMQRLVELIDPTTGDVTPGSDELLRLSLFRDIVPGLSNNAIGQFFPGAAGGANASAGFDGSASMNPWDFVLMLEGALLLRVASLRRLNEAESTNAAAPFALKSQGVGYASATDEDASAQGEQWMPLWAGATTLREVQSLFDEGRLHGGRRAARGTLDAARSVAKLGVARGVTEFVRFGYFERNGQSNLAVPVGRVRVALDADVSLLDELDPFVRSLSAASQKKGAPASLGRSLRRLEAAMLDVATGGRGNHNGWAELLCVLGDVEQGFLANARNTKDSHLHPVPTLRADWLAKLPDSVEVRLAKAIASQTDGELGAIRHNVIPYEGSRYPKFKTSADGLAKDPSVVWRGRDLTSDLSAIALRRVVDGTKSGQKTDAFPLSGKVFARLVDVQAFLMGTTDDALLGRLIRGMLSIDWSHLPSTVETARVSGQPDSLHALVRLSHLPMRLSPSRAPGATGGPELRPRLDARPLRLLLAGRANEAGDAMLSRMVASGVRPKMRSFVASPAYAARLAASVAIPVSPRDLFRLLDCIAKPFTESKSTPESDEVSV
jgi:CRISPR-associated protein Csx17